MPQYLDPSAAAERLQSLSGEFVLLEHTGDQFPPFDVLPLGPRFATSPGPLAAVLMDMDGTTTTTEDLCLHALETMIRKMTGWDTPAAWPGLDPAVDYPHIIGTSATSNADYLAERFAAHVKPLPSARGFVGAVAWSLAHSPIPGREAEVRGVLRTLDLAWLHDDPRFQRLMSAPEAGEETARQDAEALAAEIAPRLALHDASAFTRIGLELYYHRLHAHLAYIDRGEGEKVAMQAFGDAAAPAIKPLAGIGASMALVKGWLGEDARALYDELRAHLDEEGIPCKATPADLARTGAYFEKHPPRVGLVTSSTRPEASIILKEVFRLVRKQAASWPMPEARREQIVNGFTEPTGYYDVLVTASDAHELRLKPQRDLYTVAMLQLDFHADQRARIAGFEDTEAGILAQRAAGLGIPVAVPFHGTRGHNFSAASHVCLGGLPEAILNHALFVKPE